MSLSVGYAYFSESIKATGTAKTLSYYSQPLKLIDINDGTTGIGDDSFPIYNGSYFKYSHYTISYPYYYIYYDVSLKNQLCNYCDIYLYIANYANIEITDFTATLYDNQSLIDNATICPTCENYYEYYDWRNESPYYDANNQRVYGYAYVNMWTLFKSTAFTTTGTTKQFYVRLSYKSQGTTRYIYVYYYLNVK